MTTAAKKTADKPSTAERSRTCNVPDCVRQPTTRGLCDAHWMSQRGLADPRPTRDEG